MAKVAFSKFDLKVQESAHNIVYVNKKNEEINYEVKSYLTIEEKMEMISKIINQSIDDNGFYNPMRLKIFMTLEIVYAYTNISFTEKQKENPFKLYDQLISSNLFDVIKENIGEKEWNDINSTTITTIENIYKYKNSVLGILDAVSADYSAVDLNLTELQNKLADPNALSLIRDILPLTNAQAV